MYWKRHRKILLTAGAITTYVFLTAPVAAQTVAVDAALLQRLQQVIEQQQQQLERQSTQLDTQAQTIDNLKTSVEQLQDQSTTTRNIATKAQTVAEEANDTAQKAGAREVLDKTVTSGTERVRLSISGHINRAINIADDGDKTKAYFVDNDVSNSRVRFVGTGQVAEDTTLGVVTEVAFSPNNSFDVSQDNETANDFVDVRKVEATVMNRTYGKFSLGKGQAAADDTAEYDLSLVAGPIMYSGVSDIVGGLQFVSNGALTGVTVGNAFSNLDGNRQDRARYDTPTVGPGLQLSVSAGSDQRYDAALTWGGDYGDWTGVEIGPFTTLGAISIRDPNENNVEWRLAGSFSALHNPTGLSVTVSSGVSELDRGDNPYNLYGKVAWDTSFLQIGPTASGLIIPIARTYRAKATKARPLVLPPRS